MSTFWKFVEAILAGIGAATVICTIGSLVGIYLVRCYKGDAVEKRGSDET